MKRTKWPGNWKVTCDVCGFWFPSGEIKKRWDGLYVCKDDFEQRHPSTLYRYHEHPSYPAFVRKDGTDTFIQACDIQTSSGYAGLGAAGCMQAGNSSVPYNVLYDLFTNGHE